ncbi:MAG: ATP synthase subunit I [Planctomycetaceae bacterium]
MNGDGTRMWMAVVFLAGIGLGGAFFGGLWWTAQRLPRSPNGHLLAAVSFIARVAIVLLGILWLTRGDWRLVLVCLAGFLVSRAVILRHVSRSLPPGHHSGDLSQS